MYFFQAVQKKIIAWEFFVKLTQIKFRTRASAKDSLILLKLAHLKFTINNCVQFSSFGETTFLWEWNSISSLRFGKNFTKDFNVKKKIPCEFFVKWAQIRITGNSFVKFSVGGPRSIYKGIPFENLRETILQIISL